MALDSRSIKRSTSSFRPLGVKPSWLDRRVVLRNRGIADLRALSGRECPFGRRSTGQFGNSLTVPEISRRESPA